MVMLVNIYRCILTAIDCKLYIFQVFLSLLWKFLTLYFQLYGVSQGLVHLHSHQVVHGDLKAVRFFKKHINFTDYRKFFFIPA
jgi:hypothetical protein